MTSPLASLPQPNANEYPYNLNGDQTKARALAEAAKGGNADALTMLKNIGLDANADRLPDNYGAGEKSLQERAFDEANKDDERNFATSESRYQQQVAQSMVAQQKADERSNRQLQMQEEAQKQSADLKERQMRLAENNAAKQAAPKGGGGGGGGKMKSAPRSEDDLQKVKNRKADNADARAQGFTDNYARQKADKEKKWWDDTKRQQEPKVAQDATAKEAGKEMAAADRQQRIDANKAKKEAIEKGNKIVEERRKKEADAKAVEDNKKKADEMYGPDGTTLNQPKMVHAYGNVHSKVMVKARGDYA